jgi:hypothetical protein
MKSLIKLLAPAMGAMLMMSAAPCQARNTIMLGTTEYTVDTVFHAKVGPGTTQTRLSLNAGVHLDVYYLTVNVRTPGVSIRTLSGANKVAGNGRTSAMAQAHTHDGLHYFGGTNGDFYFTSGTATNGTSTVGTSTSAFTVDGEVFRTAASNYQFSYDVDGVARICRLDYTKGTATHGDATVAFKAINNTAPNNGVSIYTSKFWGSANQTSVAGNCAEVSAKLVDGDQFLAGRKYRMEVTSTSDDTGDMTVPDDGFVILGRGNAKDFVANLQPGDIVDFDNVTLTPDGTAIMPDCVVSGNPKNVGDGVNLDSEAERGDASDRHPRTGIGISADGNTIVMMVVDGRGASAGVPTGHLGDLLIYAGCAEGVNLDGGGSSTLYTEALGVRNHCSDGSERAVSNAVYAVLEAPEDSNVAEISFMDFAPTLPHMGLYTPQMLAFNQYGLCLDTDFSNYTLSCPPELGEIVDDGHTLYVTGSGCHALTATCGDAVATIAVVVDDASDAELKYPSIMVDRDHPYDIRLSSTVGSREVPLNPVAFEWSTTDADVATVDAAGTITATANGATTIVGRLGDIQLDQAVTVENPRAMAEPVFAAVDPSEWSCTTTGVKEASASTLKDGIAVDYTVSSTRGTKLIVNSKHQIYGMPEGLRIVINPGEAKITKFTVNLRPANSNDQTSLPYENLAAEDNDINIDLGEAFDLSDQGIWPIELVSFTFNIGDANKTVSHVEIPTIEALYASGDGVQATCADGQDVTFKLVGNTLQLSREAAHISVADLAGRVVASGSGSSLAIPAMRGVLIATADGASVKILTK